MSRGYLSTDGDLLVRLGPWASDLEHQTDLAVAFYSRGRLLREYRVCDLIERKSSLEFSASHYEWLAARATTPNGFDGDTFYLTLIDGAAIEFNARTGEIIDKSRDYDAAGEAQLCEEQERRWEQRGLEVLQSWPLYEEFKRHFAVNTARVPTDSISGVDAEFDGPYLDLDFYPKHDDAAAGKGPISINALVPISDYASGNAKFEFSNALIQGWLRQSTHSRKPTLSDRLKNRAEKWCFVSRENRYVGKTRRNIRQKCKAKSGLN